MGAALSRVRYAPAPVTHLCQKQVGGMGAWVDMRSRSCASGKTLLPITTSHNIARVYPAPKVDRMVRFEALPGHERYWNGFSFLQIVLSHHTYQRTTLRADTDPFSFAFANHSSPDPSSSVKGWVCVHEHAHLCGQRSKPQTNFWLNPQALDSFTALLIGHEGR